MPTRPTAAVLALLAAVATTGCGDGGGSSDAADASDTIEVRAVAPAPFEDAPSSVPAGEVTLRLVNDDETGHSLRIEELDDGVDLVPGGDEGTATVELEPGTTYTYYCGVAGHRELGMEGTFTADG